MKQFVVIDAEQGSDAWKQARIGRLTGSVAKNILIKKADSAGRKNLLVKLILERLTGKSMESGFATEAMQAGTDREPMACRAYEALTGEVVCRSGFLSHTEHMAGCSLDGHLGDFAKLLSIKCRQPPAHMDAVLSGVVPPDAMAQLRHEMWVTGALEHDYFSWNPDFPEDMQSRIVTVTREQADIPGYEREALKFLAEVENKENAIRTMRDIGAVLQEAV